MSRKSGYRVQKRTCAGANKAERIPISRKRPRGRGGPIRGCIGQAAVCRHFDPCLRSSGEKVDDYIDRSAPLRLADRAREDDEAAAVAAPRLQPATFSAAENLHMSDHSPPPRFAMRCRRRGGKLALRGGRAAGASSENVERLCGALDDFAGDHYLLDVFEARQVEHGVEQNALHDGA